MGGTFVFYSWDVMEPISYMMLFANFTAGFFFYILSKKGMELCTLREIMANRFANRLYRKKGFNIDKLYTLEKEIIELREILNKSIYWLILIFKN